MLVKCDKISVREFIVRRHQFQLKRRIEKSKEPYNKGKGLSADFYRGLLAGFEKYHLPTACRFCAPEERKENHAACVLVICRLTRDINGKIVEDEVIYNP